MATAEPPIAGDEAAAVLGELDRLRSYIEWKCGGLASAGLSATVGPWTMTLGGLLKHLALVEDNHFSRLLLNRGRVRVGRRRPGRVAGLGVGVRRSGFAGAPHDALEAAGGAVPPHEHHRRPHWHSQQVDALLAEGKFDLVLGRCTACW